MANEIYHRSNWGNAVNDIAWGDTYEKFDATNEMFVRSDNYENSNETDKLMAAINPKPSILLTPTAYDNGSLHSVKPVQSFGDNLNTNLDYTTFGVNSGIKTVTNGVANISSTGANNYTILSYQNQGLTSKGYNQKYKVSGFIRNISATNVYVAFYNGSTQGNIVNAYSGNEFLYFEVIITTGSSGNQELKFNSSVTGANQEVEFKDISIQLINDADFDFTRGSSATRVNEQGLIEDVQILSGELVQNGDFEEEGSELVTNGDYSSGSTDWVTSSGWTFNNINASFDGLAYSPIRQDVGLVTGKIYKITFTLNISSGNMFFQVGGGSTSYTTSDTYTIYEEATSHATLSAFISIFSTVSSVFTIDNVSVKEVGQNWISYDGNVIFKQGSVQIDTNGAAYTEFRAGNDFNSPDAILTIGNKYRLTYTISESNSGGIKTNSLIANDTILTSTVGTHTIEGLANLTSLGILRNGDTDITITNISVIEITEDTNIPRIDYTNGTGSLLLEPQRTNLINYSEDFSQSVWVKTGLTVNENKILSPSGSLDADEVDITAANAHYLFDTISVSASTNYTFTFYVKKGTATDVSYSILNATNFTNIVNTTSYFNEISDTDWTRISVEFTTPSGCTSIRTYPLRDGSSTGTVYIWGAQLEEGSYATSYIPTNGSIATRLADVCNNSGSSDLINSAEGVLYAEIAALVNDSNYKAISVSDGSHSNRVQFSLRLNTIAAFVSVGGSSQYSHTETVANILDYHKIALVYKQNDYKLFVNGTLVDSSASGNTFPQNTLTELSFTDGIVSNLYGNAKCVAVFKEALTDAELQKLTS
jgi:hypothetical protein